MNRPLPREQIEYTICTTGKQRREMEEWRKEREKIDRERLERQKTNTGDWKRDWDKEKQSIEYVVFIWCLKDRLAPRFVQIHPILFFLFESRASPGHKPSLFIYSNKLKMHFNMQYSSSSSSFIFKTSFVLLFQFVLFNQKPIIEQKGTVITIHNNRQKLSSGQRSREKLMKPQPLRRYNFGFH